MLRLAVASTVHGTRRPVPVPSCAVLYFLAVVSNVCWRLSDPIRVHAPPCLITAAPARPPVAYLVSGCRGSRLQGKDDSGGGPACLITQLSTVNADNHKQPRTCTQSVRRLVPRLGSQREVQRKARSVCTYSRYATAHAVQSRATPRRAMPCRAMPCHVSTRRGSRRRAAGSTLQTWASSRKTRRAPHPPAPCRRPAESCSPSTAGATRSGRRCGSCRP